MIAPKLLLKYSNNNRNSQKTSKNHRFPGLWEPLREAIRITVIVSVPMVGKRRGGLLVKRQGHCWMVGMALLFTLLDEVKARAGNRDISPAPGVVLVESRQR